MTELFIFCKKKLIFMFAFINDLPWLSQMLPTLFSVGEYSNFLEWMYPIHGGGETTSEAALGVLILWFSWQVQPL